MDSKEKERARTRPLVTKRGDLGRRKRSKTPVLVAALSLLVILLAATGFYLFKRNQDLSSQNKVLANPTASAEQQQAELISLVGALVELPTDETPTVAVVSDVAKLKDQSFFESAQNGDKVLIYTKAKKAYLYRPSTNKLINIAPVNIGDSNTVQ